MPGLDTYVRERIDQEIKTQLRRGCELPFPYNDTSTLEEIGMDNMVATDFLMVLEDEFKINFDQLITPLQDAATERARIEREKSGERSFYAPDIDYQEKRVKIGALVRYIMDEATASVA